MEGEIEELRRKRRTRNGSVDPSGRYPKRKRTPSGRYPKRKRTRSRRGHQYEDSDSSLANMGEASSEECRDGEMMEWEESMKIISDPIHDIIKIHPLCLKIIDTPEFQRLRDITQCGISGLVYPAATHSRFEHSLGVYFLVEEAFDSISSNKNIQVTAKDKLCLQIAGLCHDLGHGPFSHSWEGFILQATKNCWKHENNSVTIFKHMIKENNLIKYFQKYEVASEIDFIEHLIKGDITKEDKKFIFQIVANNDTKIDVDKWDYMLRDAFYFNIPRKVDYKRILSGMFVDKNKNLAFRDKVADDIKEIFEIRKIFHKKCYQHRVNKTIEVMLMDALLLADRNFIGHYYPEYEGMTLSTAHTKPELFLKLTNYIYYVIQHSNFDGLSEARKIIDRIIRRNLYTLIGEYEKQKNTEIENDDLSKILNDLKSNFPVYDFRKTVISASSGKAYDVLKEVTFYNKDNKKVPYEGNIPEYTRILIFCTASKSVIEGNTMKEMKRLCKDFFEKYTIKAI